MYINISKGGAPQREYPTIERPIAVGKPQLTLYTSRGQTYYVNNATGNITNILPSGFTQDDVITSNINEPEENERFINYYKPKFNSRVRGERVIPDNALREALIKDINKIYSSPTIFNFFNDYRYLLNKDLLETSSMKDLVKQYKSILNILAQHETETPTTFEPFLSLTEQFNKARREQTTVNVNHSDEIEEITQPTQPTQSILSPLSPLYVKDDYIKFKQSIQQMLESGVNKDGSPLTQEQIEILNQRFQTLTNYLSYVDMTIRLRDDFASGVGPDGVTPLTQEEQNLFINRIAELIQDIDRELETLPSDPTDLTNDVRPQTELEQYNQLIQRLQDKLENGVNPNVEPLTTEERNMYKSQIISFEQRVRDIQQAVPAEERDIEENIQHPPTPPDPIVPPDPIIDKQENLHHHQGYTPAPVPQKVHPQQGTTQQIPGG